MAARIKRPDTAFSLDKPNRRAGGSKPLKLEEHKAWIRGLPSLISGRRDVEAAHISMRDASAGKVSRGKSQKASDCWIVPLDRDLHREIHAVGEPEFAKRYGVDLVKIAAALYLHHALGDDDAALLSIQQTWRGGNQ